MQLTDAVAATVAQIIPIYLGALAITVNFQKTKAREYMTGLYRPWTEWMERTSELPESGFRGQALLDESRAIVTATVKEDPGITPNRIVLWGSHTIALIFFFVFQILEAIAFIMCILTLAGWDGGQDTFTLVLIAAIAGLAFLGVFPFIGYVVMPGPIEMYRILQSYKQFLRVIGEARREVDEGRADTSDGPATNTGQSG